MKPILTGLAPNLEADDARLALKLVFSPQEWLRQEAVFSLEEAIRTFLPINYVFSFESGRTSLFAILSSLGLQPGDEVLVQSFTCVAVPDPILWAGLKPIYVDCDETLTMDPADLKKKITPKSKAVIIQHTFGYPANLDELLVVAKEHNLFVIEDCAHTIGATYLEKKVGTFGHAAIFSFGRDKPISSVFGGVAVTNDENLAQKLQEFKAKAQDPSRTWILQQLMHPLVLFISKKLYAILAIGKILLEAAKRLKIISLAVYPEEKRGERPAFTGKKMPNALALLALHQRDKLENFNKHRTEIADFYTKNLANTNYKIQKTTENSSPIPLRFTLSHPQAPEIIKQAKTRGILFGDWYAPCIAPKGVDYQKVYYDSAACPHAEGLSSQVINLPTDIHISLEDASKIIDFLKSFT